MRFLSCIFPDFPIQIPENARGDDPYRGGSIGGKVRQGGMQIFPKFGHFLPFLKNMEFFMQFLYIFRNIFGGKIWIDRGVPYAEFLTGGLGGLGGLGGI